MHPYTPICRMVELPFELVDLIIDELKHDIVALRSCSLVCKTWLPRSSAHLFSSFRISSLPSWTFLIDYHNLLSSSTRVPAFTRNLEVNVVPERAQAIAALIQHLPQLDSLSLVGIGLFRDSSCFPRPNLSCTGRTLRSLRGAWLPADLIACFLALFTSVETLDVRFGERAEHDFRQQAHRITNLVIKAETDFALLDIACLVRPDALESLAVDIGGTYHHQVAAERFDKLLQLVGRHIKRFEYAQPLGGWVAPPSSIPALFACAALESITVTTPKASPFSMRLWLECLVLLSSLLPHVQRVRLVTSCRGLPEAEHAFQDLVRTLDWQGVAQALVHCRALEVVEVAALDCCHRPIAFVDYPGAREAVVGRMPAWLRSIAVFE
ncbi:hypothetical protein PsYK624_115270 [Phanerochaete sordida]|uniref:F-box domain-containing protein n=1 Tax=Phanerochaete sordida TaxID=48140 RepID=A0A9P3GG20_9APHY|nr:hypothetical protein PsYK624_115270 [Phanerochaete sordida]